MEIVHDVDDERFVEKRKKEYDGTVAKGGVRVVSHENLPKNANLVGNRYVLTIRNANTTEEIYKTRWILLRHHDILRHLFAKNSPMLMRPSLRITLFLTVTYFLCKLWLRHVEQAFMQSKKLSQNVFTKAHRKVRSLEDRVLQAILPHCGLVE